MQAHKSELQTDKDKKIKIKKIKLKQLTDFARSSMRDPAFRDVAPISRLRAASQAKNPYGEPDDIALLLALYHDRCIGYHGLLPGVLNFQDQHSKIYWLVTFYLDPTYRGKGYGKLLVAEILGTGVDLATTGITKGAEAVYRRVGFRDLGELSYFQLRLDNPDQHTATLEHLKSGIQRFRARPVQQVSDKFRSAGTRQNPAICFQRGLKTVNWMIAHPWVVSRSEAREDVRHYHFSRVRDFFSVMALEIYRSDDRSPNGYVVLSVSRKRRKSAVKILDFHFENSEDVSIAGYLGLKFAADHRIDRLECSAALAPFYAGLATLKHDLKHKQRLYLFRPQRHDSPLAKLAPRIELNYCDSDTAFT
jgi:GNAT superfamily N-acetyltransferase